MPVLDHSRAFFFAPARAIIRLIAIKEKVIWEDQIEGPMVFNPRRGLLTITRITSIDKGQQYSVLGRAQRPGRCGSTHCEPQDRSANTNDRFSGRSSVNCEESQALWPVCMSQDNACPTRTQSPSAHIPDIGTEEIMAVDPSTILFQSWIYPVVTIIMIVRLSIPSGCMWPLNSLSVNLGIAFSLRIWSATHTSAMIAHDSSSASISELQREAERPARMFKESVSPATRCSVSLGVWSTSAVAP